jgi:hypothetical protein
MRGAIPPLLQYAFIAWCSVKKVQGQFYLYFYKDHYLCVRSFSLRYTFSPKNCSSQIPPCDTPALRVISMAGRLFFLYDDKANYFGEVPGNENLWRGIVTVLSLASLRKINSILICVRLRSCGQYSLNSMLLSWHARSPAHSWFSPPCHCQCRHDFEAGRDSWEIQRRILICYISLWRRFLIEKLVVTQLLNRSSAF